MKLLVLYGPPAAGKLTIGKLLVEQTGMKLFHNHVSIDVVKQFFERGTSGFETVVYAIRKTVFEEAAKANLDLIFTVVYFYPHDNPEMQWMIEAVENHGGTVEFMQLVCPNEVLLERVSEPSRQAYGKIVSPELLQNILQHDLDTPYPERKSLRIDTSNQTPQETAEQIIQHFHLTTTASKSS